MMMGWNGFFFILLLNVLIYKNNFKINQVEVGFAS